MKIPLLLLATTLLTITFNLLNGDGYYVNLHQADITDSTHTYKLYDTYIDSFLGINPISECTLNINPVTKEYEGLPLNNKAKSYSRFRQWMKICELDKNMFNLKSFLAIARS